MSEDNQSKRYPFDYEALVKGQVIPAEECERLTGRKRHERRYSLDVQHLIDGIERERELMGAPVVAKQWKDGIKILTDAEAIVHLPSRFKAGMRLAGRSHRKSIVAVDTRNLTQEEARIHDRNRDSQGRQLEAAALAKAKVELLPHRRQTPGLPEKKDQPS